MKKFIIYIIATVVLVSCYNKADIPEIAHVYTDLDFAEDYDIISIKYLKTKYSALITTDANSEITDDYVIRGKVISTDEESSIYKSLYIIDHQDDEDDTRAIELRLFSSNYVSYPVGSMVYVKLNGLSIGDYGGVLSIGAFSQVEDTDYSHTTIEGKIMLKEHIFLGEKLEMEAKDTLRITKDNYNDLDLVNKSISRLVRIEDVESCFGSADGWAYYSDTNYPSYFSSSSALFDWSEGFEGDLATATLSYYGVDPTDATSTTALRYYGSSWYSFDRSGSDFEYGQYVLRISGYAKFRETEVPSDGTFVNITAILTRYDDTLQLNLNHGSDLVVLED